MTESERFPIRLGPKSRPLLRLFGVHDQEDAMVVLADGVMDARFGSGRLRTPISNIVAWRIDGPWRWIAAIGIRQSFRRPDITFGGDPAGGVRMDFREPVPFGPFRQHALWVTVIDLDGLAAALSAFGIPGVDARKAR